MNHSELHSRFERVTLTDGADKETAGHNGETGPALYAVTAVWSRSNSPVTGSDSTSQGVSGDDMWDDWPDEDDVDWAFRDMNFYDLIVDARADVDVDMNDFDYASDGSIIEEGNSSEDSYNPYGEDDHEEDDYDDRHVHEPCWTSFHDQHIAILVKTFVAAYKRPM
ncbi:hypothetical protein CALCODRAFT_505919 [Calocera cornea HHB12733]|uniref:Uncharacterized protein n=1 Tax=Calocera cornea HHB12733 TaxID=1353952 RepID=A0A165JGT0_9BASI|nr:hypothetical protein CALCODRAFT_505919 [Calocera cornea HHB12733]